MGLYKEQRYEMKGLPDVTYEGRQVSSPILDDDTKTNMEVDDRLLEIGDASELDTPQKVEQKVTSPELERKKEEEEERGSSPNSGNSTEAAREAAAMSEAEEEKNAVVILGDDVSSKVLLVPESYESVITRIHH